jgi:arylsulfatase A-like enzyme
MMIRRRLAVLVAGWILVALVNAALAAPPNVVLVFADDFGWTDLKCYGSDLYVSPNLDRLAKDGMRFTQNYSACTVCSPTRAALLTGKYPGRLHITDWIPGMPPDNPRVIVPDFTKQLPHEEVTIAEKLKKAGYATASIGKWHLGGEEFYPETHGFDVNIAGTDSAQPRDTYFAPYNIATIKQGPPGEYITDRLTTEAVNFIRKNKDQPFFVYLPHFAVHTPVQGKQRLIDAADRRLRGMDAGKARHVNTSYAAMIESLDQSVGRIRSTLKELGLDDNTVIIFTSDNGGRVPTTSNAPLRVGKGSCYEGGVRVPLIVYWPNVTKPGSESDVPTITMDIFPTLLEMTGQKLDAGAVCDGESLVPVLRDGETLTERPLFWHYPHYQHYQEGGTTPYSAIRRGDHKLIEFLADGKVELYNIKDDIGETKDLAASNPSLVKELRDELHAWRKSVDAQMTTPNPKYDSSKPEYNPPAK